MNKFFTTKRLCRAGVIAALYVALTTSLARFAFGPLQFRPAEALCILPVFFPEAVPALYIGCMLSNILSQYSVYDVLIGSLATLLGALGSYMVGRLLKKEPIRFILAGIFPVLFNALLIPFIIVFLCGDNGGYASVWTAYFVFVGSIALTESFWIYGLGSTLYYKLKRLQ